MKIPFIYRFLLLLLCLLLFRFEVKADREEALDRTIRLPKLKGTVYSMLQKVSTDAKSSRQSYSDYSIGKKGSA